jgi:hypothetical protein
MKGKCLCGGVAFELREPVPNLYQCHCSLCRRATGSSANAALRIPAAQFSWLAGEELIAKFETENGFKSHFCCYCGSPLPNPTAADTAYWVPAGLLEDAGKIALGAHLYIASRASWDIITEAGEHYDEMPDADALDALLRRK